MKFLKILLLLGLLNFLQAPAAFCEDEEAVFIPREEQEILTIEDEKLAAEEEELQRIAAIKPYTRFGRHNKKMREACVLMHFDGRLSKFFNIVSEYNVKDIRCSSCKNLFKTLKGACKESATLEKGKKQKYLQLYPPTPTPTPDLDDEEEGEEEEEEEAEEEEVEEEGEGLAAEKPLEPYQQKFPPQREPQPEILAIFGEMFFNLSQETSSIETLLPAVEKFKQVLESSEGKTKGEKEYFTTIAQYSFAPFEPHAEVKQAKKKQMDEKFKDVERKMSVDDLFDF